MAGRTPASLHDTADWFEQRDFAVRFGWGPNALRRLAPKADAVVIVDVLSFSTCVDIVVGRGATVLPYKWHDGSEAAYGVEHDAVVAKRLVNAGPGDWILSPSHLAEIPAGTRLVLPSPNGSALAFAAVAAGAKAVFVACLRNASAVARALAGSSVVSVIGAGERWRGTTGPLRPAVEDLLGAGAVIDRFGTDGASPEGKAAAAAWRDAEPDIRERLGQCGSGRELEDRGFGANVALAAEVDISDAAPILRGVELVRS